LLPGKVGERAIFFGEINENIYYYQTLCKKCNVRKKDRIK